jgi:tRNA threonylcarbamoyladenosine biosynthesis protein TsaB
LINEVPLRILAIDTATPVGSIALVEETLLKAQYTLNVSATHNQRLLPGIHRVLSDCTWTLDSLDAFAVSIGPGSFTGLRIGMSVMKGLAWATEKPLIGVPTLDALAANLSLVPHPVCSALDARKGEIYAAIYRLVDEQPPERLTSYMVIRPENLVELITEKTVFVGDALLSYGDHLQKRLGERLLRAPLHLNSAQAGSVAWLARYRLLSGVTEEITSCTPLYVRPSEAELNLVSK